MSVRRRNLPGEKVTVETCLRQLQDAIARLEHLSPGETADVGGVPFDRATLANLATKSPHELRALALEALAVRRQILATEEFD